MNLAKKNTGLVLTDEETKELLHSLEEIGDNYDWELPDSVTAFLNRLRGLDGEGIDAETHRFAAVARSINSILREHNLYISEEGCLVDRNKIGNTGFELDVE